MIIMVVGRLSSGIPIEPYWFKKTSIMEKKRPPVPQEMPPLTKTPEIRENDVPETITPPHQPPIKIPEEAPSHDSPDEVPATVEKQPGALPAEIPAPAKQPEIQETELPETPNQPNEPPLVIPGEAPTPDFPDEVPPLPEKQ